MLVSLLQMLRQMVGTHHEIDVVIGVASVIFPVFGLVYGIFDVGSQIFTHKSLSENAQQIIEDNF